MVADRNQAIVYSASNPGHGTTVLTVRDVAKEYGATRALQGVSFELRSGQVYGLIGVNGSGKSTLMKILAGAERATVGEMILDGQPYRPRSVAHAGRLGIGMVSQELPLVPHMSVADNVLAGQWLTRFGVLRPRAQHAAAVSALRELGADLDVTVKAGDFKLGEQQLTVIARTLTRRPRVLLLDEPTSALGGAEVDRLRTVVRAIADQGRIVLIVSQRLDDVFSVCDRIMVLRNGRLVESAAAAALGSDRAIELMLHGRSAPGRQTAANRTGARVSGATNEAADGARTAALEVREFAVAGCTDPLTLNIGKGEIVGLAGLPGSGASEFMRALFGLRASSAREAWLFGDRYQPSNPAAGIRRGIAYVTGDRQWEGLIPNSSVLDNITMARTRAARGGPRLLRRARSEAIPLIASLRIRPGDPSLPVRALSGGNQQKVVFARWMLTSPTLWLLDDATRGVDIGARREIHAVVRAVVREGRAALMVSSDLFELFETCDRIVVFRSGAVVADSQTTETTPEAVEALAAGMSRSGHEG